MPARQKNALCCDAGGRAAQAQVGSSSTPSSAITATARNSSDGVHAVDEAQGNGNHAGQGARASRAGEVMRGVLLETGRFHVNWFSLC